MSGLPQDDDATDERPDMVVSLPAEILAMMAAFEASAPEPEATDDPVQDALSAEVTPLAATLEAPEDDQAFEAEMAALPAAPLESFDALSLPPVLDLTAAAGLHTALLARRGTPLSVDASEVKRLGGQCLQLLLSARLTWRADGVPIALVGASEAFGRDLALLGLNETTLFESEAA